MPHTLTSLVSWVIAHGYFIFFIGTLIEGSLVTIAGGVAVALGYYNIWIILLLSILGDITGDLVYYAIGYKSKNILHSRFFRFFGATDEKIEKITKAIHNGLYKALVLVKLTPVIGPPGLIVIGTTHVPIKRYLRAVLIICVIKSASFTFLGFFSGKTYMTLSTVISSGSHRAIWVIAILGLLYVVYRNITTRVTKKLEE